LIEDAKAYRARVVAKAKADVAQFNALYSEYAKNPDIIKEKIYTESMKEFISNNNIVIDTTSGKDLYKFYNMQDDSLKTNGAAINNPVKAQTVIEEEGAGN
jgi:membrane protease subunit HflK